MSLVKLVCEQTIKSLGVRLLLAFFAALFGIVMLLIEAPEGTAPFFYGFAVFCLLIAALCFAKGRVADFLGSVIALVVLLVGLFFLEDRFLKGNFWNWPTLGFVLLFCFPIAQYLVKAKFGFGKRRDEVRQIQCPPGISAREWAETCAEFFEANDLFPPYEITREYALAGADYGAFSILWEPFELSLTDYEDIKQFYLETRGDHLKFVEPNREIKTSEDLTAWRYEIAYGVPFEPHKKLLIEITEAMAVLDRANECGHPKAMDDAGRKLDQLYDELEALVDPYFKKSGKER